MAVDFQVIFPSQVILLSSVQILQGVTPRTLDILGEDFRSVDEVLINDVPATNIVILSKQRMLVQMPDILAQALPNSVTVVSNSLVLTDKSMMRFRVGSTSSKVSGILRLVQIFLKILFTTPGKDIFAPRIGAAALKNLGLTFGSDGSKQIVSDFIIAVGTAARQIVAIQSRDPTMPLTERLLSAKVTAAQYDRNQEALIVSVELLSQTGQAALANLVM